MSFAPVTLSDSGTPRTGVEQQYSLAPIFYPRSIGLGPTGPIADCRDMGGGHGPIQGWWRHVDFQVDEQFASTHSTTMLK